MQSIDKDVDPRLTIIPLTGSKCCGYWKQLHKSVTPFEETGLTIEDLTKPENNKFFRRYICCNPPIHLSEHLPGCGRCRHHGALKFGKTKEGYAKFLPKFTEKEIAGIFDKEHKSLDEQLSLLNEFIGRKLAIALDIEDEYVVFLKGQFAEKLDNLIKNIEKCNMNNVNAQVDELKDLLKQSKAQREAQLEVRQLVKEYTEVFKVEAARRSLSGEYVSKKLIINGYTTFFNVLAQFIPDEQKYNARVAAGRVIKSSIISGNATEDPTSPFGIINGLINPNEGADSYSVQTEQSSVNL